MKSLSLRRLSNSCERKSAHVPLKSSLQVPLESTPIKPMAVWMGSDRAAYRFLIIANHRGRRAHEKGDERILIHVSRNLTNNIKLSKALTLRISKTAVQQQLT